MNNGETILIIDDEMQIRRLLEITLQSQGYQTLEAVTGKEGINLAASHHPDLVILDLGLPDISGHDTLKSLREWYTNPVIILSIQSSEDDIIRALDNGANDYLVKPFRTGELLARIRTALRGSQQEKTDAVIVFGDMQLDLSAHVLKKKDEVIKLTATEYNLLALFAQQSGRVLTHQYLLRQVWGPGYLNQTQYLRVFIAQLRKKIEADPNQPACIITESGVGYRFIAGQE